MTGMGMIMRAKSVNMLIAAFVLRYQSAQTRHLVSHSNLQPHCKLINAFATGFQCPESADWYASEDAAKHRPACVRDYHSHQSPTRNLELLRSEYSAVLEKY
jgi:hypothetical protein